MTQPQIENNIKKIIFKYLSPKNHQIFVYGSRAAGRARKWSDYDIGILGDRPVPDRVIMNIETELEESPDIVYNIDVVDFSTVSKDFKSIAMQKIIPWTT